MTNREFNSITNIYCNSSRDAADIAEMYEKLNYMAQVKVSAPCIFPRNMFTVEIKKNNI